MDSDWLLPCVVYKMYLSPKPSCVRANSLQSVLAWSSGNKEQIYCGQCCLCTLLQLQHVVDTTLYMNNFIIQSAFSLPTYSQLSCLSGRGKASKQSDPGASILHLLMAIQLWLQGKIMNAVWAYIGQFAMNILIGLMRYKFVISNLNLMLPMPNTNMFELPIINIMITFSDST